MCTFIIVLSVAMVLIHVHDCSSQVLAEMVYNEFAIIYLTTTNIP